MHVNTRYWSTALRIRRGASEGFSPTSRRLRNAVEQFLGSPWFSDILASHELDKVSQRSIPLAIVVVVAYVTAA